MTWRRADGWGWCNGVEAFKVVEDDFLRNGYD
jgi:hypothetical protein